MVKIRTLDFELFSTLNQSMRLHLLLRYPSTVDINDFQIVRNLTLPVEKCRKLPSLCHG